MRRRPRRLALPLAFTLGLPGAGCGDDVAYPTAATLPEGSLMAKLVDWNPKQAPVGAAAALAEHGDDLVVLSDQGVLFFRGGALQDRDPSITTWRQAARAPAPGLPEEWPVGIDGTGRVRWLRGRGDLEDVTDRYGLPGPATDVAALGRGRVGFALGDLVWIAEGKSARRYDGAAAGLRGGAGRAVATDPGAGLVRVFDAPSGGGRSWTVPGVLAAVVDPAGKVVCATATSLYIEAEGGALRLLHRLPEGDAGPIRDLSTAATGVWVALGDGLALLRDGQLLRAPAGLVPTGGRLLGSPTGDLWIITQAGALLRVAEDSAGGDRDLWKRTVLPIFTRTCSQCHQPGAAVAVDLSTYAAWDARRELIERRVIQGKPTPMPPPGAPVLTTEEINDLKGWLTAPR